MRRPASFVIASTLSAGAVFAVFALFAGCTAERATVPEDVDTGISRTPRDAAAPDVVVAPPETDAGDGAVSPADASDASDASRPVDAGARGIVVNEVFAADILSRRYVELAGPPGAPIGDLLLRIVSSTGSVLKLVAVSSSLTEKMPARGTWVVGGVAEPAVDQGYTVSSWDLPSESGSVQLVHPGPAGLVLVDVVGYGTPAASVESPPTATSEGLAASLTGAPPQGALLRKPPGRDTGDNAGDFCTGAASPNRANVCVP